ncbi:hypothetical protein C4J81_04320 [Deltaproteobacteria bacterium Smac51]|nr:hypothetical protein C4J81_04320 [Deltaproteobacteria bacterium Smac51]
MATVNKGRNSKTTVDNKTDRVGPPDSSCRAVEAPVENISSRLIASTLSSQATNSSRLESLLKVFNRDDKVLIIISADPDAIASAVALKRILWRRVAQIVIASTNHIKRTDNKQLVSALKLKMESLSSLDICAFTRLAMVDSQPHHCPLTQNLVFDAIIDHHPAAVLHQKAGPGYADVRPELGATATMMVGYLKAAKIRPNQKLATALFYAIKTDTQNFVRQGQLDDMRAFQWLYPHIHNQLLSDIERAPIARSSFKRLLDGLNGAVLHKNMAHTFLPNVDHADTLVLLADFLMMVNGVNRAVAAGICGDRLVLIFRAGGMRQNVGKLAAKAFDKLGSAGGHKNMARAEVPLKNLDPKIRNNFAAIARFIGRRLTEAAAPVRKKTSG